MTRQELMNGLNALMEQQAALNAQIAQFQEAIRQLDDAERTAKINEVTELLANATLQQVDYVLNYLRGVENIPTPAPQVAIGVAVPETDGETIAEPTTIPIPTPTVEPTTEEPRSSHIIVEPIMEEPDIPNSEPVTYTEQANVEDYLVDGRIPWTDATISVVGLSHQEMWTVDHDSPQIGDIVKLYPPQRRDGRVVRSILAHTVEDEPRAIGILPQGAEKVAELEAIGAPIVKNRDAYADEAMRNGKYATVVGVVPGRYCFLKLNEEENPAPTEEPAPVEEEPAVPEGVETILEGFVANATEARRMFEAQKRSWHLFSSVEEVGRWFKIEYYDNRCNSNDFIKYIAVAKAEE